ncbi:aromatic/alkene monooxygenase hydroxylase subunit beta [Halomonas heilongjiangensis]|uniref:Phenol hydroxylase n=1 Tax=Halomonas heilongjiangensis TaxID=1387883 RepID=A0A2N7TN00_9GAMM|nr:aromatic/alkene monooxygenase hydroxylase subunit beta [Halomonas heilongjiangensis]PMR69550.1 phenol hydroxylase [Halomonas heilongjiangensis]PXX89500.1 phenol hydroxylase [Halomonas heilongjiangensis]
MSVEIKTTEITPIRQTYGHTRRRFGDKPATRYQEASFDIQPTSNFHYRPMFDEQHELYDPGYTALKMEDWYAFSDPRQFYYGAWVGARAKLQESTETSFAFFEKRNLGARLDEAARRLVVQCLLPLRHVEMGANMNNVGIAGNAYGTTLSQAHMFHGMDRLAVAQYLTRIGLLIDESPGVLLAEAKNLWMEDPAWQGVRRYVEDTLVVEDWAELSLAQNLIFDGLLYPFLLETLDERLLEIGGGDIAMLTDFMGDWFKDGSRFIDALFKTLAGESEANRAQLTRWVAHWRSRALEALTPVAIDADIELDAALGVLDKRLAKLGLLETH